MTHTYLCRSTDSLSVTKEIAHQAKATANAEWTCACSWKNRAANVVCGGGNHHAGFGCGLPRSISKSVEEATSARELEPNRRDAAKDKATDAQFFAGEAQHIDELIELSGGSLSAMVERLSNKELQEGALEGYVLKTTIYRYVTSKSNKRVSIDLSAAERAGVLISCIEGNEQYFKPMRCAHLRIVALS